MRKRTAASPANYDFAKAYSELVKLRKKLSASKVVEIALKPTDGSRYDQGR
jgi:hypothetical protein